MFFLLGLLLFLNQMFYILGLSLTTASVASLFSVNQSFWSFTLSFIQPSVPVWAVAVSVLLGFDRSSLNSKVDF